TLRTNHVRSNERMTMLSIGNTQGRGKPRASFNLKVGRDAAACFSVHLQIINKNVATEVRSKPI
ncbi:MAG: hypothetical protein P8Y67_10235, partial [Alphaproteobacteria bacterium]